VIQHQNNRQLVRYSINGFINEAFRVIEHGKRGLMSKDEALDELWELLINIDYEIKSGKQVMTETLVN